MPETTETLEVIYAVTVRHDGDDSTPNPGTSDIEKWIREGMGGEFGSNVQVDAERH